MFIESIRTIYISRPKRLFKYRYGIRARLREIEAMYFTDQIRFNNNDVVIDCGSNIGELALAIRLKKNIRIFAIEPDKIELKVLKRNLQKHDVIFSHFVSDKSSIQKIVMKMKQETHVLF
jgi:predicted RNA methylase